VKVKKYKNGNILTNIWKYIVARKTVKAANLRRFLEVVNTKNTKLNYAEVSARARVCVCVCVKY